MTSQAKRPSFRLMLVLFCLIPSNWTMEIPFSAVQLNDEFHFPPRTEEASDDYATLSFMEDDGGGRGGGGGAIDVTKRLQVTSVFPKRRKNAALMERIFRGRRGFDPLFLRSLVPQEDYGAEIPNYRTEVLDPDEFQGIDSIEKALDDLLILHAFSSPSRISQSLTEEEEDDDEDDSTESIWNRSPSPTANKNIISKRLSKKATSGVRVESRHIHPVYLGLGQETTGAALNALARVLADEELIQRLHPNDRPKESVRFIG